MKKEKLRRNICKEVVYILERRGETAFPMLWTLVTENMRKNFTRQQFSQYLRSCSINVCKKQVGRLSVYYLKPKAL